MPSSTIGKKLHMHGDRESESDIQIEGTVEGDVRTAKVTIGECGSVHGTIVANNVVIAGVVIGEVQSRTVALVHSARVRADILFDSLVIEAGARFEGRCKRFSANAEAADAEPFFSPLRLTVVGANTGEEHPGED